MELFSGKLFLVTYIVGKIAMTVGPVPDNNMEACEDIAKVLTTQCDPAKAQMTPYKCSDVKWVCEYHETRPPLDPSFADEDLISE